MMALGFRQSRLTDLCVRFIELIRPALIHRRSGLGLSIIRRIMEIFEGRVVIENIRPHGLRIILEFPKKGENHE